MSSSSIFPPQTLKVSNIYANTFLSGNNVKSFDFFSQHSIGCGGGFISGDVFKGNSLNISDNIVVNNNVLVGNDRAINCASITTNGNTITAGDINGGSITAASSITDSSLQNVTSIGTDSNGTLIDAASDLRLKSNITYLTGDALSRIISLRPISYNFNNDTAMDTKFRYGLGAQDVREIIPSAVTVTQKQAGQIPSGTLCLDWNQITAMLIGAIKEQQGIIINLIDRVVSLENK